MKHLKIHFFIVFSFVAFSAFAQDNQVILKEDFNDNTNNWLIEADQTRVFKIENGNYFIQNKLQYNSVTSRISRAIDVSRDFEIEAEISKEKGFNKKGFGLVWGREKSDYYGFYITGGGEFLILKWESGTREFIVGTQASEFINRENSSNTLKIKKEGDRLYYYVNDNVVQETEFFPFFGNELGFANGGKLSMNVNYLYVNYLDERETVDLVGDNMILNESFNDNSNSWPTGKIPRGTANLANGEYKLVNKSQKPMYAKIDLEIDHTKDFIIEANVLEINNDKDDSFCIMWGANMDTKEYYAFRINTFYGSYEYYRIRQKEIDKLLNITFSTAINKGERGKNNIKIKKSGKLYEFYINDKKVNDFRFQPFFGNHFGFINHFKHQIIVDDIAVRYLTPSF